MSLDVAPGLRARVRSDELAQVLANLLQNAVRYTPVGGRVEVSAARVADGIDIRVANTGPDIPREDLPRVWERFYRVEKSRDREHGGAGIGLAIVKQLVETGGRACRRDQRWRPDDVPTDAARLSAKLEHCR